jgi:hypothetical protein
MTYDSERYEQQMTQESESTLAFLSVDKFGLPPVVQTKPPGPTVTITVTVTGYLF